MDLFDFRLIGPAKLHTLIVDTHRALSSAGLPRKIALAICHFHFNIEREQFNEAVHHFTMRIDAGALRALLENIDPRMAAESCNSRMRKDVGTPLIKLMAMNVRSGGIIHSLEGACDSDSDDSDIAAVEIREELIGSCLEVLLEFGADLTATVVQFGSLDGTSVDSSNSGEWFIHALMPIGFTALMFAALNGLIVPLRLMLLHGHCSSSSLALLLCCSLRARSFFTEESILDGSDSDGYAGEHPTDLDALLGVIGELLRHNVSIDRSLVIPVAVPSEFVHSPVLKRWQAALDLPISLAELHEGFYRASLRHLALLSGDEQVAAMLQDAASCELQALRYLGPPAARPDDSSEEDDFFDALGLNFSLVEEGEDVNLGNFKFEEGHEVDIPLQDVLESMVQNVSVACGERIRNVFGVVTRAFVVTLSFSLAPASGYASGVAGSPSLVVTCSSIAGSELAKIDASPKTTLCDFRKQLATKLEKPPLQLRLVTTDGHLLKADSSATTFADLECC